MYIVAHVPPGVFELVEGMSWFYADYNRKYLDVLQKYTDVIQAQMYGHEHTDSFRILFDKQGTVNQLVFVAINFCIFVFMGIFVAIYFCRLQTWTMQEQCKVCLYGHFCSNLFSRIRFSHEYLENKSLAYSILNFNFA